MRREILSKGLLCNLDELQENGWSGSQMWIRQSWKVFFLALQISISLLLELLYCHSVPAYFQSMASLPSSPLFHPALHLNTSSKKKLPDPFSLRSSRRCNVLLVRAVQSSEAPGPSPEETISRRQTLATGVTICCISLFNSMPTFAAETKKGFTAVTDRKDGYSFLYPFGWQEVVIQGQDKVFKDVIEPLESVSVNLIETTKQDVRDLGSPQQVAEALIKKVLAPTSQKTELIEAKENDVDGKAYFTFEFVAQAPNFTRHALGAISIGNGKFYTLTTGANERRWEKIKDKLHTVVDSFKIFNSDPSAPPA